MSIVTGAKNTEGNINEVKAYVNGYTVKFTEPPVFRDGLLFLDLNSVVTALGYNSEGDRILFRDKSYEIKTSLIHNDKVFVRADEILEIQQNILWATIKIDVINLHVDMLINKSHTVDWKKQSPKFENGILLLPLEQIVTTLGLEHSLDLDSLIISRHGKQVCSTKDFTLIDDKVYLTAEKLNEIKTNVLWATVDINIESQKGKPRSLMLDVPMIPMLPDYPTGCEIISVKMMLAGININIDSETFRKKIPVSDDPRTGLKGDPRIPLGDPQGRYAYWVYSQALIKPVESVAPVKAVDLTGITLEQLMDFMVKYKVGVCVHLGRWSSAFIYHNVLVVGFDEQYIYINEPYEAKLMKLTHQDFKNRWAVTAAERSKIPYYAKNRAFSIIPTESQMKNAKYKLGY